MSEVATSKAQTVGEINYIIGGLYRPRNSVNDSFMSELSYILNNALNVFQNSIFYIKGDFNYDLFSIN